MNNVLCLINFVMMRSVKFRIGPQKVFQEQQPFRYISVVSLCAEEVEDLRKHPTVDTVIALGKALPSNPKARLSAPPCAADD